MKIYLLLIVLLFPNLCNAQTNKEPADIVVDSMQATFKSVGMDMMKFGTQSTVGFTMNLIGTGMLVFGISNPSSVSNQMNPLVGLGIFTNCLGAVVTVLAPRHIGRAGRKLNRLKR
jgi:hypothetical protein